MKNKIYLPASLLAFLFLMTSLFSSRLSSQCSPLSDSLALVALYNATEGDGWTDNSNWLVEGQEVGTWHGITADVEGCVIGISVSDNNLIGSIPSELGNLSELTTLRLTGNQLTGSIPPSLESLSNLVRLYLSDNQLTGIIPSELGTLSELTTLFLNKNQLTGSVPPELGSLNNLTYLWLFDNQLTGNIPSELGGLNSLELLALGTNQLTGSIPPELGNLSNLLDLHLYTNQLTGSIPPELGNLSSLRSLNLGENQLTGTIPLELLNLSNLTKFKVHANQLTGSIPSGLGGLSELKNLYLYDNQLTGSIPPELGSLSNLIVLYLDGNQLTGDIPSELGSLNDLVLLYLNGNQLTGSIPPEFENLSSLARLYLYDNQLIGRLPIELSHLINLQRLLLSDNQFNGCFPPQYSIFCSIDSTSFLGNPYLPNSGNFNAFCENEEGACTPNIIGQITFDENLNCLTDALEIGLQQWMVKVTSVDGDFYGVSGENGDYSIYTYPEEYTVEVVVPGPYWEENCTDIATVDVLDSLYLDTVNFFPNALVECPFMTVDISTPLLRRCFANTYVVNYCNSGTTSAEGVSVVISFDDLIDIDSASITITEQMDNVLTFDLGDVAVNECGSFLIYTNVSCDSELGQAFCATAHIYPDSICAEISPEWSGATVEVEGDCDGDEVIFVIENTGEGDMLQDRTYIVIEDGLILLAEPNPFILNSNGDLELTYPANGSTYICQAMQVDNHPIPSMPTAFVEGCGTNEDGGFSTGYVTQFPVDDDAPFVSIDCQEVIGSYDPNDKNGYPKGYGEEHFIERGQDIDYHIRFQNTGTDTAFTVVIKDAISPNLEMTSLRLGASSHPYSIEIEGSSTLKFIFENILLPDSTTNEPLSHGFVKFKISQKTDLDLGATIENQAAIFFDFNESVLTNTTLHTIGENFVQITAIEEPFITNLKVSLAPNPMVNEAIIRISGIEFKNAQLSLFNTLGVLLREETFNGNEVTLKRGNLSTGIYFFEIIVDGQKGFAGKMVVE